VQTGYTLPQLLAVLVDHGYITEADAKSVSDREDSLRARALKERNHTMPAAGRSQTYEVSPAELVAAARIRTEDGVINEDTVMEVVAMASGHRYVKIDPLELDTKLITSTLSRRFAERHIVMPLKRDGNTVRVAVDNPYNLELTDSLRSIVGGDVDVVVSSKADILKCIREIYGFQNSVEQAAGELAQGIDLGNLEQLTRLRSAEELDASDAHVIRAVDYLLHYALEQRASDIHLEPKRQHTAVRLRIDGVLHTVQAIPKVVHPAVVSRIKSLCRMDIAERRKPQDGRIKTTHGDREVELRISTLPVAFGEKVVIRIFDPDVLLQTLDGLGFFSRELALFTGFLRRPNGILLVTGPTGSGKTTTLYSGLRAVATADVNVVTIEDPIEMVVEEFNQVAVQSRVGITFASALRTILRQDPDIIMVGEIRDGETADNAVQAALTGHLVFSTLHTNDAPSAITRLQDLGVQPFLIASSLTGVVAQRLVRKVCPRCKRPEKLTRDQCRTLQMSVPEGRDIPDLTVFRGLGCAHCRHTGLLGRTGVFEVMPISDRVRKLISESRDSVEIGKAAKLEGMMSLRECAIKKMAQGIIPFEEVIRVTADAPF
jgi:general secretion pathway protein E